MHLVHACSGERRSHTSYHSGLLCHTTSSLLYNSLYQSTKLLLVVSNPLLLNDTKTHHTLPRVMLPENIARLAYGDQSDVCLS